MKWSSIKWAHELRLMLAGAAGFWLPDTALHGLRGQEFNGRDVRIVTVVAPLTLLITFLLDYVWSAAEPPNCNKNRLRREQSAKMYSASSGDGSPGA
jgi:hypothetical protein